MPQNQKNTVSYFGPNTSIEGDIHSDGAIHIDGKLTGSVISNADIILGETSKVFGQVQAKNIMISGHFKGNIHAVDGLEIFPTGHVEGDIKGSKLSIHEGGIYKGKVNMDIIESQSIYDGTLQIQSSS